MADERDPDISRKYLELGAEEPPRALDEAILAASRRAVSGEMRSRPVPLIGPGGRRRWYFPVAAAAVITLAVAVTVQVERQKPDDELTASAPAQERKEQRVLKAPGAVEEAKPAPQPARVPKAFTPEPPPAAAPAPQSAEAVRDLAKSNQAPLEERARSDSAPASPPVVAQAAPAPTPEPARREMEASRPQASAAAGARVQSKVESPDALLERITELRKQGKHEEADKALEEFRKRYPDYRISDEVRAKIERK